MRETTDQSARSRLITATEELLRERGMSGTGIKEVVARSGAPIGSMYHYFPAGKAQLVSEALAIHAAKLPRLVERFFDGKRGAVAAVETLFSTAATEFERLGANKGCAIGAVALDLMPDDTDIQRICREAFDDWVAAIAPRLPFDDAGARRSFAVMIVVALEGAFVLSRAAGNGQSFRDAGRWLSATLSAAQGSRPGRTRKRTSRGAP